MKKITEKRAPQNNRLELHKTPGKLRNRVDAKP